MAGAAAMAHGVWTGRVQRARDAHDKGPQRTKFGTICGRNKNEENMLQLQLLRRGRTIPQLRPHRTPAARPLAIWHLPPTSHALAMPLHAHRNPPP